MYKLTLMKKTNPDFLNGVPELLSLKLLEEKPMHGYDLIQEIQRHSNNFFQFGEGSIYPMLHKLERQGYIDGKKELINGRNRIVYSVTRPGTQKLEASKKRFRAIVAKINPIIGDHYEPSMA